MSRRTFVAGHRGLVGSSVVRALVAAGESAPIVRTRSELDLLDRAAVRAFFAAERPDAVFLAAARVGGIHANNTLRWDFLYENLAIEVNVISVALEFDVDRLVFFGSSCVYPKLAPQPIREEYLLSGSLEPTNEPYAVAKIAGLKLVEAAQSQHGRKWVSLMPTNLYGPGDNFDMDQSHVVPAMIRKFHEAKMEQQLGREAAVTLWGTGRPRREFLHVDDLARAAVSMLDSDITGMLNVGFGTDFTIREVAEIVSQVVDYTGSVTWDASKPDGTPRKLLDSSRMTATGWVPRIGLKEGLRATYAWYTERYTVAGGDRG